MRAGIAIEEPPMSYERWNREELYNLVWTRTLADLAKEYEISAVGLGKMCVRHEALEISAG
jgi:DNA topoisomerase IA